MQSWIPPWEDPIFRFLRGRGELTSKNGTFTLYELLCHHPEDDFPLLVNGKVFSRDELLSWATYNLKSETGGTFPSVDQIKNMVAPFSVSDAQIAELALMLDGVAPAPTRTYSII